MDDVKNGRVTVTRFVRLAISRAHDGRLRISSPDVPGLLLSSKDEDGLWRDLGPAMQQIMAHNE